MLVTRTPTDAAAAPVRADPLPLLLRLAELAGAIERLAGRDGEHATLVPGLTLLRLSQPCAPVHAIHRPALCVIAQGAKHLQLADELYAYDASTYLAVVQDLPVMAQVVQANEQAPYLCLRLDFDAAELAQSVLQWASAPPRDGSRGLFVGSIDTALLDPLLRLVRLLDAPDDIAALAPLITREVLYRLLTGAEGWRLGAFAHGGSQARRIALAIAWLREHFAEPLRIEDLARVAHMSASSLHRHFKAVTAMSPVQYQQRLRLVEARRLTLAQSLDAASAALRVGYQSPSQFSREYSRLFGAPPARDLRVWRERHS
jgi:AraC-like DNA-binding protein